MRYIQKSTHTIRLQLDKFSQTKHIYVTNQYPDQPSEPQHLRQKLVIPSFLVLLPEVTSILMSNSIDSFCFVLCMNRILFVLFCIWLLLLNIMFAWLWIVCPPYC